MRIVSDTSPITSLAAIDQLELLHQLYDTVIIPQAVYEEMTEAGDVPGGIEVQTLSWIQKQQVQNREQAIALRTQLNRGESEAIVLAMEIKADLLILDEKPGRIIALQYGLKIIGVLGVLLEAKQKNLIRTVKPLIDELIDRANFRVNAQLYTNILGIAGEQ
ncbi:MAG: DUF3368 domain-containing protein [Limnoraphis robusta]|uniref:Nucleic acid-binding protein n=1 Tax=Limnoraphis robusta CS-951 TaxID=1637645 RepID=A0A0F5Y9W4_9CYAN|nr:DUF3368 domain-containing protein [Limnoraphis robusta]KKD35005.1 nucleic acid-binding protein [Limnoraphis robusta CS-951]